MSAIEGITRQLIDNSVVISGEGKVRTAAAKLASAGDKRSIEAAAKDFEAVFITQMLHQMFAGVETDHLFGGGHAEETFRTFLYDEYGKAVSRSGGIGIAEHVQNHLLKLQEVKL